MRLIVIGPPGAGKGTQSQRLLKYLGVPHISTGDILREAVRNRTREGMMAERYMNAGNLVPDSLIIELVGHRLGEADCARGCLLDGFPRTLGQAQALDAFLRQHGKPLDGVVELKVDDSTLIERMVDRGRSDDKPQAISQRLYDYRQRTEPLLHYYRALGILESVNGVGTQEEVFKRMKEAIDRLKNRRKDNDSAAT